MCIVINAEFEATHDIKIYHRYIREGLSQRAAAIYSDDEINERNRREEVNLEGDDFIELTVVDKGPLPAFTLGRFCCIVYAELNTNKCLKQ